MSKTAPSLDLEGAPVYAGIDVHRTRWVVSLRSAGLDLKTFSMNPSPEELARHLRKSYPGGRYLSVYEAGYCGYWIHERLVQLGIENIVVHPADVPTTSKERTQKTDKRDSKKLARERESGSLEALYVPSVQAQQVRSLSRLRFRLVSHQTRLKNRIKGFLAFYGYPLPDRTEMPHWSMRFIDHLRSLEFAEVAGKLYLDHCLDELMACRLRLAEVMRGLRRLVQEVDARGITARLRSVPGVGPKTAITLYCELVDMDRFRRFDELASYVGLVPSTHDSGDTRQSAGMTHRRNRYLRTLLIEAAWVAVRKDPAMTAAFAKLTRRMPKQKAIVRIAKKLLRRIRYVWKHGQPYEVGVFA